MTIIALTQAASLLLAATSDGKLLMWRIPPLHHTFDNGVALVPQFSRLQVDPRTLTGVVTTEHSVIAFNSNQIYHAPLCALDGLKESLEFSSIAASQLLSPEESINSLVSVTDRIVIGGSLGTIILLDEEFTTISSITL